MAVDRDMRGGGLRDRLFAWYWRRKAARAGSKSAAHRELMRRKAVLDGIASRLEAELATGGGAPAAPDAVWSFAPDIFATAAPDAAVGRPESGVALCAGLNFYHDCSDGDFFVSQRPCRRPAAKNRFEIAFESFRFDGGYVSFVASPTPELRRPGPRERLILAIDVAASRPVKTFMRLHVSGSGGHETFYAEDELGGGPAAFTFDLAYAPFELTGEEKLWVDIIFDRPRMVEIVIRDLALSLYPEGAG